ncbi:MAG: hypothetical protein KatS3mg022_2339 [Armatimonadota bacterium]|nr:MAG: hypothetical protein KatS3mg022_2339 [Armatimonadota bacterium]
MNIELLCKEDLIMRIYAISQQGWHKSVKHTVNMRNDGAVGNTLESLLGITENNLPIPNAQEWEIKAQRKDSTSLVTLKHVEPSPRACKVVTNILLPLHGWRHQLAGKKYPQDEMSFRQTIRASQFTDRGFTILVDREAKKLRLVFDHTRVKSDVPEIAGWLEEVKQRTGFAPLNPEPFWAFDDLEPLIAQKLRNCFYVIADSKIENEHEWFRFEELYLLSDFRFDAFLQAIETGDVLVDFDARTRHNHGTKFRLRKGAWPSLYANVQRIFAPDQPLQLP